MNKHCCFKFLPLSFQYLSLSMPFLYPGKPLKAYLIRLPCILKLFLPSPPITMYLLYGLTRRWKSVVLSYLEVNKLACLSFMDADRKYELRVGNNRLYYRRASGVSVMVASDPFDPQVTWRRYKVTWVDAIYTMEFCWETPSWRNLSLPLSYKETYLTFVLIEHIIFTILYWKHERHYLSRWFTIQASLKRLCQTKPATFIFMTCRNLRDLWTSVSQRDPKSLVRWIQLMTWPMVGR